MKRLFGHRPSPIKWLARIVLLLLAVAAPAIVGGAVATLRTTSNDPRQWLPQQFEETDTYDWFERQFGTDEVAIVSWPGCTLEDPRVSLLAESLRQSQRFNRVRSGPSVLAQLTASPPGLSRSAALRRLRGILIGPDGETTCLVLTTSDLGKADRSEAVLEIQRLAAEAGVGTDDLRLAGPTVDAAAIDAESRNLLFRLAGISAVLSFLIAALRLRSILLAIVVLTVALYSTACALAVVSATGGSMNLLMTMLPPLVYVLSISSAVHLANYYRDATSEELPSAALATAVRQGWRPCVLSATTTAIGLASLVMSTIEPIRMFGIYSAIGVVIGVVVLFVLMPAALTQFPPAFAKRPAQSHHESDWQQGYVRWVERRHFLITGAFLTVMLFCSVGLGRIESTVKLQDRFLEGSDVIADYRWLERNIGPMVPLEIVLHFEEDDGRDFIDRLGIVAKIQQEIESVEERVATMSAVNLAPPVPRGGGLRSSIARAVLNHPSTQHRLEEAHYLAESDEKQLWRITVRAEAIGDLDYGVFAESLASRLQPLLEASGLEGTYTGVIPLIYKAQRQLLTDLVRSFLAAFGVIAVVMIFVLRGLSAAMLSMIPNLFPAITVFGAIAWVGIPVQIGSVMTASAALGIAVDDTVHFLTWFRRGAGRGLPRDGAIHDAFSRCSGAVMHTTSICAGGLLVFAASSFVPILHFAWLMVLLLAAALLGDLVLLPSILSGPLGKYFEANVRGPAKGSDAGKQVA